jgi:hypothetical protein
MLSFQIMMTLIFVYVIAHSIFYISDMSEFGRPGLIITTFILALLIDQVKSVVFLGCVYFVVVRRFMHLSENESEYLD